MSEPEDHGGGSAAATQLFSAVSADLHDERNRLSAKTPSLYLYFFGPSLFLSRFQEGVCTYAFRSHAMPRDGFGESRRLFKTMPPCVWNLETTRALSRNRGVRLGIKEGRFMIYL